MLELFQSTMFNQVIEMQYLILEPRCTIEMHGKSGIY